MLAGAALFWRERRTLRLALAALPTCVGALTLGEYVLGLRLDLDQLFLRDVVGPNEAGFPPGRMAPATAFCFVLLGLALMGGAGGSRRPGLAGAPAAAISRRAGYAAELLAVTATVIGSILLIAYPTRAIHLRQWAGSISPALHTAVSVVVLGIGILCAADGLVIDSLRLRGTGRALWIGFGVLTLLLASVGVAFTLETQTLAADLDAQANVARPRREATLQMESALLGYGLAERLVVANDARAASDAARDAVDFDRRLADYRSLARSPHQRELATRAAGLWREVHASGQRILEADGPPSAAELATFSRQFARLQKILKEEMRLEAFEAFEARKTITLRDLRTAGSLPLLLLVVSVLIALVTTGGLARAVSQQEEILREQREWLRVTLSSIGDGVIACDTERRITFLNPVAEALTGWKTEEALGQPMSTVFRVVSEQTREPAADIAARSCAKAGPPRWPTTPPCAPATGARSPSRTAQRRSPTSTAA